MLHSFKFLDTSDPFLSSLQAPNDNIVPKHLELILVSKHICLAPKYVSYSFLIATLIYFQMKMDGWMFLVLFLTPAVMLGMYSHQSIHSLVTLYKPLYVFLTESGLLGLL